MSVSRMKNLIILVLSICAACLLAVAVPNRLSQTHEQRRMLAELKTLYESYGLRIELDELPRSPTLYSVELSESGAQTAAQALLGQKAVQPDGGDRFESEYTSELGTLTLTRTGGFSAVLTGGASVRNYEKSATKLLHSMGFQFQQLSRRQTEAGVTLEGEQTLLGVPVFGSGLTLSYADGQLQRVEGTFYTGSEAITRVSEQESISGADALARLLVRGHRIDNIEEAKTVRVTADAIQIEPLLVAPVVAIPILLLLLILLLLPKQPRKKHGGEADEED